MGQTCACISACNVHESRHDALVAEHGYRRGDADGQRHGAGYRDGPIQNCMQYDKVVVLVDRLGPKGQASVWWRPGCGVQVLSTR